MNCILNNNKTYNLLNINPDNFKESRIEVNFRNNVTKENYLNCLFLSEILSCTTKNLPRRMDFYVRSEELYNARITGNTTKIGDTVILSLSLSFINPAYALDDSYLDEAIKFLTDTIFNPLVINEAFDENTFNVVKNSLISDLLTINENPTRVSMKNLFNLLDSDSNVRIFSDNYSIDDVNAVTKEGLYSFYKDMLEHFYCDVIVVGDIDFDRVNSVFAKNFNLKVIKNHHVNLYSKTKFSSKLIKREDASSFNQSTLLLLYNLKDLTIREKYYTINIFDYIFCNGSFKSKLFKKLREENSLCYGVSSFYMKFDSMYGISSSLGYDNISFAKKLIKEAFKEMKSGIFNNELLDEAKKSMTDYLKTSKDNIISYSGQGLLEIIDNFPSVDERIKAFNSITKEEVINITNKIELKVEYVLKEVCYERD